MPFEQSPVLPPILPRRIAVIGGGISGMVAADQLAAHHHVTLIEAAPRLGGHAMTVLAGRRGDQPVDMGFIVFNKVNYPGLTALFDDIGAPIVPSDMSFAASIKGGWLEYGTHDAGDFLAQKRNLIRPGFYQMFADMRRFNTRALGVARANPGLTIGGLLEHLGTGDWFRDYYITPISGAIWSTPCAGILEFPALALLKFFENHNLLGFKGQHPWFTVAGGSRAYVTRLAARMEQRGVDIRLNAPVRALRREAAGGVSLALAGAEWAHFDAVVLAVHADAALGLLSDARPAESAALSKIRYQPNLAVLHCDDGVMPKRRRVWSSWNYAGGPGAVQSAAGIDLTYWMNRLQPIPKDDPLFVTLNPGRAMDPAKIYREEVFRHPLYDRAAFEGQAGIAAINGQADTWFCGAWMGSGFHEDGLQSAMAVVRAMAEKVPAA